MTNLPTLRAKYGAGIGVELFFAFPDLQDDQRTYLDADSAAGVVSLSANGVNFAVSQYAVIGQPGSLKTEIVQLHAATAPTSTTITLASATSFAHNRGDVIRFIPYNQITPSESTDGVTYTGLSAVPIRADSLETYLQRPSALSTYFYKFQYTNSSLATSSASSDPVPATGLADNTIGAVKARALDELGEVKNDIITDAFLNNCLQEARRAVDQNPAVFRFTFRTKFNTAIGQCVSGAWSVAAPSDLRDRNTYKNILGLRIGKQFRPCIYQDRVRFVQNYLNVAHSTTSQTITSASTSITFASTADFDDSGSLTLAGSAVGVLVSTLSYSGNNRTTNTLSGCVVSLDASVPAGSLASGVDAWQNATFGLPTAYTIDNGMIYFDVAFYAQIDGRHITLDYYQAIQPITTDSQAFDEPFYDLYVSFLKFRIKYKKANGKIDRDSDTDWKDFMEGVGKIIGQETNGQRISFIPDIEGFLSATE